MNCKGKPLDSSTEDGLTKEVGWLYGQIVPIGKENSRESNNPGKKCLIVKY